MSKETYIKTAYFDGEGNLKKGYVPASQSVLYNENENKKWTPELETHKKNRIVWLEQRLTEVNKTLQEELTEWDRLKCLLFRDQLMIDLREDKLHLEYKGQIPKVINDRCIRKSSKAQGKYRKMLGDEKFKQLFDEVNVDFWDAVVMEDKATGGGKYE